MSIYATLDHFYIPAWPLAEKFPQDFIQVMVQAVPPHVDYTGHEWDFLPPPVAEDSGLYRFVVVCGPDTKKGSKRNHQEYVNPLFTLTGEEYARITWDEMWRRIEKALESRFAEAAREHSPVTREILETRRKQKAGQPV
jgi:hypothetical protein